MSPNSCHVTSIFMYAAWCVSLTFWSLPAFFQILFPQHHGPLHHSPKLNGSATMAQSATFMKCCNRSAASKKALDTVFMCTYTNNQFIIPTETLPLWEYRHRNFIFNTAVCQIAVGIKGFRKQTIFAQNPGFEYEKRESENVGGRLSRWDISLPATPPWVTFHVNKMFVNSIYS